MKNILVASIALLTATTASAAGRISAQPTYWLYSGRITQIFGLSVYQPMSKFSALNTWVGLGEIDLNADRRWFTYKSDVDVRLGRLTISPGAQINQDLETRRVDANIHTKLSLQLW